MCIAWRLFRHQSHAQWIHLQRKERRETGKGFISHCTNWTQHCYAQGPARSRGRAEFGITLTLTSSPSHRSSQHGVGVRLLWAPVVWKKQLSPNFVGANGRACRTKAITNSHLLKGGCSWFERFSCKLCRSAQNFNGCLPTKVCH